MKRIKRGKYTVDKKLFYGMITACVVGILAILSATLSFDSYQNVIVQTATFFVGLACVWVAIKIDYTEYKKLSKYI